MSSEVGSFMPGGRQQKVAIVTRTLENETFLSEAVMLPGEDYYSDSARRSRIAALNLARRHFEEGTPERLQGCRSLCPPRSPGWMST